MREEIKHAIGDYQCKKFYGISLQEFLRQRKIIAQYGSLEAYERHLERERERQQEKAAKGAAERREQRGCEGWYFGFFWLVVLLGVLISLVSNC